MLTSSADTGRVPKELPLVGRSANLESLYTIFGDPSSTAPSVLITGEGGVGKSRLASTVGAEAKRRGWRVAYGRAYPVETGAPYALLGDAFMPVLGQMDDTSLSVLTRGSQEELRQLFPALGLAKTESVRGDDHRELRTRLFWTFTEMVQRLGEREPLLIVLEDLHWADSSSIALLHFLIRHLSDERVRVLGTYNTDYRHDNEPLIGLEQSLLSLRRLRMVPVHPLNERDTEELVKCVFNASGLAVEDFSRLLFGWTGGNPYFIEQTLDALVETGRLYLRDGTWLGWTERELELPSTVRDAILVRCRNLSATARAVAEVMAVVGRPTSAALLEEVSGVESRELVLAVEELVRLGLIEERQEGESLLLEIRHPITRATLYKDLCKTKARMLHVRVADGLERLYDAEAMQHADELAYHFKKAHSPPDEGRALRYLVTAGRSALQRHADQEAVGYLQDALKRLNGPPTSGDLQALEVRSDNPPDPGAIGRDLARAHSRLGQYGKAQKIWRELLEQAMARSDGLEMANAHRNLGLIAFWSGHHAQALDHLDAASDVLETRAPALEARIQMTAGVVLQEMGKAEHSRERLESALILAMELGDAGLLARSHRALALLHTWLGEAEEARKHGWRAVELADQARDRNAAFWGRWALAALEGLSGGPNAIEQLMSEARAIADELRSPVLRLWVAELSVEYAHYSGDWDRGLAEGERAIDLAESLNQRTLLVRLQVWTAITYLHRGDLVRGRELVERSWKLVDGARSGGARDLHSTVPAYIGRVALAMAEEDYAGAIGLGREGLAVADSSGYVIWVLHRLLPMLGEALLRSGQREETQAVVARLRREGQRMDHRLALAWALAGDAINCWHDGRVEEAVGLLRDAGERMEDIGILFESARLRRQLAGRLAELGDRDAALVELKRVHAVLAKLGAKPELEKVRGQFREVGSRAPNRTRTNGTAGLTGREVEVALLVASRKSNKKVAKTLGIAPRTVTTHLSNIYRKLDIGSRGELVDLVREARLPRG